MPKQSRRATPLRRTYTGEDAAAAKKGVGRGNIGLVQCSPQQRRFRALLALSLFNFDSADQQQPIVSVYNANRFLSYTKASPMITRGAIDPAQTLNLKLRFDGKWVIHPAQIETATVVFTPSECAVHQARRVLQALEEAHSQGSGAIQLDGQMLDEAVTVAARRVLAQVSEYNIAPIRP